MSEIFYAKNATVRAIRFTNNNQPGDKNLNEVCIAANQGRPPASPQHCWHNGTSIMVTIGDDAMIANVGDWIVLGADGSLDVRTDADFEKTFGSVPSWANAAEPG